MKTIYLIKSLLPLAILPIAPWLLQIELAQHGLANYGTAAAFMVVLQIAFTAGVIAWIAFKDSRSVKKSFLRMSCVSKKVFHAGRWMTVETYLSEFHNITVSHGMTPEEQNAWIAESEQWLRDNPPEKVAAQDWLRTNAPDKQMLETMAVEKQTVEAVQTQSMQDWLQQHTVEQYIAEKPVEECLTH